MNLLILEPEEVDPSGTATITGRRARHVRSVIRSVPGDRLRVGVLRGPSGEAVVRESADERLVLDLSLDRPASPRPPVDLVLALPRPKVLRRVLQAVAAFGVGRLVLVNAWRVEKSYFSSPLLEPAALRAELVLGCEQGRTTWLPELEVAPLFVPFVEGLGAPTDEVRIVADPVADALLEDVAPRRGGPPSVVAVGPEGGWIDAERRSLVGAGFAPARLGDPVLRTETAVAALLAQLALLRRIERS